MVIIVFMITFTLSADWTEGDKTGFMNSCTAGVNYSYCQCAMNFLRNRRPNIMYVNTKDMLDAAQACKHHLQ